MVCEEIAAMIEVIRDNSKTEERSTKNDKKRAVRGMHWEQFSVVSKWEQGEIVFIKKREERKRRKNQEGKKITDIYSIHSNSPWKKKNHF